MKTRACRQIFLAGVLCLGAGAAWGQSPIVSNLNEVVATSLNMTVNDWYAQSFITDAESHCKVHSIVLNMPNRTGAVVSLYSNTGGDLPNTSIATFTYDSNAGLEHTFVRSVGDPLLTANTRYWIVASGNGDTEWNWTNSILESGAGSIPGTATWAGSNDGGGSWGPGDGTPFLFRINYTAGTCAEATQFQAQGLPGRIELRWQASAESGALGFNVHRAKAADGVYQKVNASLIPVEDLGRDYRFVDNGLKAGDRFFYKLEILNSQGQGQLSELVASATAQ